MSTQFMLLTCGTCVKTLPELYMYDDSDVTVLHINFWFGHFSGVVTICYVM